MPKRNIILLLVLFIFFGLATYWILVRRGDIEPVVYEKPEEQIKRSEKFYISGDKTFPVFTKEVIVDPFKIKEGEEQIFSIWAKDPKGIEKVTAIVATDAKEEVIELELVEGTNEEGRWMGSWTTKDVSVRPTYSTVFQAINKEGKDTKMSLFWQVEK